MQQNREHDNTKKHKNCISEIRMKEEFL